MRKIGILTFHRAENFGAVLQAFSLQSYLEEEGYEAVFIDYRCKSIENNYKLFDINRYISTHKLKDKLSIAKRQLFTLSDRYKKKMAYRAFRKKYLKVTQKEVSDIEKLEQFDIVIVGSDQVWALGLTGGFDDFYFLNYNFINPVKKISYAASSEIHSYDSLTKNEKVRKCLNSFDALSVRENTLKELLQTKSNKKIEVCLDPVFIVDPQKLKKLQIKPEISNYILIYHLVYSEESTKIAEEISKNKGLEIIEINVSSEKATKSRHKLISNIGPQELLGYMINAEYVITTSFHALALSIIFKKEFFVVDKGANIRLKNLLDEFNLRDRITDAKSFKLPAYNKIDYNSVQEKLSVKIESSKCFLRNQL